MPKFNSKKPKKEPPLQVKSKRVTISPRPVSGRHPITDKKSFISSRLLELSKLLSKRHRKLLNNWEVQMNETISIDLKETLHSENQTYKPVYKQSPNVYNLNEEVSLKDTEPRKSPKATKKLSSDPRDSDSPDYYRLSSRIIDEYQKLTSFDLIRTCDRRFTPTDFVRRRRKTLSGSFQNSATPNKSKVLTGAEKRQLVHPKRTVIKRSLCSASQASSIFDLNDIMNITNGKLNLK